MQTPELVIFDLDGTLIDSVPDIAVAVDAALAELDLAPVGEARVRDWVGNGAARLMHRALTGAMQGEAAAELFERAMHAFNWHYSRRLWQDSHRYPGTRGLLEALRARGIPLACVTNKPERFTTPLLAETGLASYFDLVLAGDSLTAKKPDPLPLLTAMQRFDAAPGETLMVGDSAADVGAARAAGVGVVCLSYGYNHGSDVRELNPDRVFDSLGELKHWLDEAARCL